MMASDNIIDVSESDFEYQVITYSAAGARNRGLLGRVVRSLPIIEPCT